MTVGWPAYIPPHAYLPGVCEKHTPTDDDHEDEAAALWKAGDFITIKGSFKATAPSRNRSRGVNGQHG